MEQIRYALFNPRLPDRISPTAEEVSFLGFRRDGGQCVLVINAFPLLLPALRNRCPKLPQPSLEPGTNLSTKEEQRQIASLSCWLRAAAQTA
jgi:hypothetical protein